MRENGARVSLGLFSLLFSLQISSSHGSSRFAGSSCQCEDFPIEGKPFVAVWNAPTGGCEKNFSIAINLKDFDLLANKDQTWNGQYVTVFYNGQLGYYPYFTNSIGTRSYNGGMPQLVNLDSHLEKSRRDIIAKIPDPQYRGLAMIDWEGWRPVWERNWDSKKIYQTRSIEIARSQYPDWPMDNLVELAKQQFEDSSRRMMEATIKLGRTVRPHARWGFYGFPTCYGTNTTDFKCSAEHVQFNDQLSWMFDFSTALFPSIYLPEKTPSNRALVRGRLMETVRLSLAQAMERGKPVPIFPYFRFIYVKNFLDYDFLSDEDLKNTIGQAADLGAAGVVMWGNRRDENTSPQICHRINHYIETKLGPYYKSLAVSAERCSETRCQGKGRCIRGVASTGVDINQNDMIRTTCPGSARTFTHKNTNNHKHYPSSESTTNTHSHKQASRGESSAQTKSGADKAGLKKSPVIANSHKDDTVAKDVSEVLEQGLDHHGNHELDGNQTSSEDPNDVPTEMVYCNTTTIGTTKCVLVKGHTSAELSKHSNFHMPKIYAVLISISLGGALVLSTVYIGTYYYFNIYKKQNR